MSARLREHYLKTVLPALQKEFGYTNVMAVPKLEKITVNIGLGACDGAWVERPLQRAWKGERLAEGRRTCQGPMMKGWPLAIGPMALLSAGEVKVAVSSRKVQAMDQEPFRHLGVEPRGERLVALKSSVHFRADFEPIADSVLVVESPGAMVADPARLPRALEITARTADGVIMAVRHASRPTVGVQFHPESVGTPLGRQILANFLAQV